LTKGKVSELNVSIPDTGCWWFGAMASPVGAVTATSRIFRQLAITLFRKNKSFLSISHQQTSLIPTAIMN